MTDTSKKYPIEMLVLDERLQARAAPDNDVIAEYAAAYKAKAKMPPVDVFDVAGVLYVVDGWHRIAGALLAGEGFLRAVTVGKGDFDYATWLALAANQQHGVRRTPDDKRRAVRLALESSIGMEQSSRAIAEHLGVSDVFVSKMRAERDESRRSQLQTFAPNAPAEPVKRIGKDGRARSAPKPKAPKPELTIPSTEEPEPVAVDYPVEDDVPLPHEPETPTVGMPPHGPELLRCAGLIAKLRVSLRAAALPNGTLQTIESELKLTEHRLRGGVPEVCPRCHGAICGHCYSQGWVTRDRGDSLREIDKRRAQ